MKSMRTVLLSLIAIMLFAVNASADAGTSINGGDTVFVFISAALVMLMLPGLFLLYAGMVRSKNVLNIIMQSFILLALVSVQWVLFGYSIAFGPDKGGIIGSLSWAGLNGVGLVPNPDYSAGIPHQAFMMFQLMFAIITVALLSGSVAERMRFPAFLVFSLLWTTLVYDPLAHWVWGVGGWMRQLGVLDFSGGTVVEMCSGVSGLVMAVVLGKRKGYGKIPLLPHNLPLTVLGAGILWFGWFGFNAGSALSANGVAINAFTATNTAGAAATLSWVFIEWLHHKKPTVLGAASGSLAGLVAITPACGYVGPLSALIIGVIAGGVSYYGVSILKAKFQYDDSLDVFGVHGIAGTWGTIATGLFAQTAINKDYPNGLFFGNPRQLVIQLVSVLATYLFSGVATFLILKAVGIFMQLRATAEEEDTGLDITQHGENAYEAVVLGGYVNDNSIVPEQTVEQDNLWNQQTIGDFQVSTPANAIASGISKIECIVRPGALEEVKAALSKIGIAGMSISQIMGCGLQMGYTHKEVYRGTEYNINLLPKIKIELVLLDEQVDRVVNTITSATRTGGIGDGKIFLYPINNVMRIRTGETGKVAI